MAIVSKAEKRFSSGDAVALSSWAEQYPVVSVITDVDNGNISAPSVVVTNPNSQAPTVFVDRRSGAGLSWRHFMFAVENVEFRSPLFIINRATRDGIPPTVNWKPVYTTDFVNWTQASVVNFVGGVSGTIQFSFPGDLPSGRVYIASNPMGRVQDAASLIENLLTNNSAIATPTASADSSGVYAISPSEIDDAGRSVGGNNQYSIKLAWGGATTDGQRKRKLVMINGIHAAGESQSWNGFKYAIDWMVNSASAEAVSFRANWDVYVYCLLNPNGVKGGNYRTTFRNSTDPNRDWRLTGNSVLQEITNIRAAIETDTGTNADMLLSWHGDVYNNVDYACGTDPDDAVPGTRTAATQILFDEGATLFGQAVDIQTSGTYNTEAWWGKAKLGCKVSLDLEIVNTSYTTLSWYQSLAEKWFKAIVATDATGVFLESGSLSADALISVSITAELQAGSSGLNAGVNANITTLAALSTQINLAAETTFGLLSAGVIDSQIYLQSNIIAALTADASLQNGSSSLSASAAVGLIASCDLSTSIKVSATASISLISTGVLQSGSSSGFGAYGLFDFTSSASLIAAIRFLANAGISLNVSGNLADVEIDAPLGSGYMAGLVKSSRRITSNRSRPTYN